MAAAKSACEGPAATRSPRWRANALAHLAGLRMVGGDEAAARRSAVQAIRAAQPAGAWEEEALARGVLGWCLALGGRLDEGVEQVRAVWVTASRSTVEHVTGRALAHAQLADVLEFAGRLDEAAKTGRDAAAWAAARGLSRTFGTGPEASEARDLYLLGRWDEAGRVVDGALERGGVGAGWQALLVVAALLDRGRDPDEIALEAIRVAREARAVVPPQRPGWLAAASAERWLGAARPAEALGGLGLLTVGVRRA